MDSFTCRNRRRRHHHQPQDPHHIKMEGETCCGWHERALLHEAGLTHSDILYAQFKVGVAQTPYCIAVDHEWESIVIAIRGTFSLEDAVADLQVRPEPLDECGNKCGFDGRAQYCHAGVFACAQWIYNDVEQCVFVSFCFFIVSWHAS
jgi:sn1-specific diacylglycerol lipase